MIDKFYESAPHLAEYSGNAFWWGTPTAAENLAVSAKCAKDSILDVRGMAVAGALVGAELIYLSWKTFVSGTMRKDEFKRKATTCIASNVTGFLAGGIGRFIGTFFGNMICPLIGGAIGGALGSILFSVAGSCVVDRIADGSSYSLEQYEKDTRNVSAAEKFNAYKQACDILDVDVEDSREAIMKEARHKYLKHHPDKLE